MWIPVYFPESSPTFSIQIHNTTYYQNTTTLTGSPQTATWGLCDIATGQFNVAINNNNIGVYLDDDPAQPQLVALRGLHYLKVNFTIPTVVDGNNPRKVSWDKITTQLPSHWFMKQVSIRDSGLYVQSDPAMPANEPDRFTVEPQNVIYTITFPIPDNVPFDYGRSAHLIINGRFDINMTHPSQGPGTWITVMERSNNQSVPNLNPEEAGMLWLERNCYDIANRTITFRVRKFSATSRGDIIALRYLAE